MLCKRITKHFRPRNRFQGVSRFIPNRSSDLIDAGLILGNTAFSNGDFTGRGRGGTVAVQQALGQGLEELVYGLGSIQDLSGWFGTRKLR